MVKDKNTFWRIRASRVLGKQGHQAVDEREKEEHTQNYR
jgi:hypothetical protein